MDTVAVEEKAERKARRRILGPASIKSLPAPETGTAEYFDDETRGLSLRVTSTGTRTWSLLYRNPQGRLRRLTLGQYDQKCGLKEARILAGKARGVIRDGKDPAEQKQARKTAVTVQELFDKWMEVVGSQLKGKGAEEQRMFNADLTRWKDRNAAEMTKDDMNEVVDAKLRQGFKTAAVAVRKLVSRFYNFGIARGIVAVNPVVGVKPQKLKSRQRVLTEEEIVRVWNACDPELVIPTGLGYKGRREPVKLHLSVWFKLRLVTLQRGGELLMMRWQDLQRDHWWLIPGAFTKNGYDHMIYLNATARDLIKSLPKIDPVWVFPAGDHPNLKKPGEIVKGANTSKLNVMGDAAHLARRIAQPTRADIVLSGHEPGERCVPGFTGHDLRRTATTILARGGVPRELSKKVLNHAKEENDDVTAVYDRYAYMPEKKAIYEFWDRQLTAILAGEPLNTVGRINLADLPVE